MAERANLSIKKPEAKRENKTSQTKKSEPSQSISSPVEQILFLQRTIGNQAVGRFIKSGALQAKLRIGQPGDIYEQEADRVAEQVMRMPEPKVSNETKVSGQPPTNSIQRKCPGCKKGTKIVKEEEEEKLQKKEASGSTHEVTSELESRIGAVRGGGQPLPESLRAFYEPRFGHDFSRVRVHSGGAAGQSARDVNAYAYTVGHDIVFGAGRFAPVTHEGRHLIAHELTHVVQQLGANGVHAGLNNGKRGLSPIQNAQETGELVNKREANPVVFDVVQRQPNPNDEGSEIEVVESVIEALQQPNPIAGFDVDRAYSILNKYSLPFLLSVLADLYDRGYFYGLLCCLAPGTKADDKVIVAIRFIQCQKEPTSLGYEEIIEAQNYLKRLYDVRIPPELQSMLACLERERVRHEKRREQERIERELRRERQKAGGRQGPKTLTRGRMDWWLVSLPTYSYDDYQGQSSARIQIMFTPNGANRNKTITFLQTVHQTKTSSGRTESIPLLDIGRTTPFDPFYGADISAPKKEWEPEGAPKGYKNEPSSAGDPTAYLYDEPSVPPPTEDKPEHQTKMFETVAVVPATGEVLGALRWGVSWASGWGKVLGGESNDCTDAPSAAFGAAIERFYATPKTIDVAKSKPIGEEHYDAILDGFIADDATLTQVHKKKLDQVVEQFKKFSNLSAIVGGFADESEKDPFGISERRAANVESYLLDHGVQKKRIEIGGYGATWARFPSSAKENRNRRVQILLHF